MTNVVNFLVARDQLEIVIGKLDHLTGDNTLTQYNTFRISFHKMDYESTVNCIKSCITSVKGGLPLSSLQDDFRNNTGEVLNPQRLGFSDLKDLLLSIDEIYLNPGNILVVRDKKTEHLSKLISKQKGQTKVKAVRKSLPSRYSAESRNALSFGLKKGPSRTLRDRAKKLEAEVNRLLPSAPSSAKAARNILSSKLSQDYLGYPSSGNNQGGGFSGLSKSKFGSTSAVTSNLPFSEPNTPSAAGFTASRGRGRGRLSLSGSEALGGWSGSASPMRDTSSPDVRSVASGSVSKVDGTLSTAGSLSEMDDQELILLGHQLIGDAFLAKVSHFILGASSGVSESHLCKSTLDFPTCLSKLKRTSLNSDNVILMLGLTDIMKGKDLEFLKSHMLSLLEYLRGQTKRVVVCTIPVPPSLQKLPKPRMCLQSFNEWLITLKLPQTRVIDLLPYTQTKNHETLGILYEGSSSFDGWNESACWTLVEALLFSGVGAMSLN